MNRINVNAVINLKWIGMKTKVLQRLFLVFVFGVFSSTFYAQEKKKSDLADFEFVFEMMKDEVVLHNVKGNRWGELSFSVVENKSYWVDEGGTSRKTFFSLGNNAKVAAYVIEVKRTKTGIEFKGVKGVNWDVLHFKLPLHETIKIDQFGVKAK